MKHDKSDTTQQLANPRKFINLSDLLLHAYTVYYVLVIYQNDKCSIAQRL